MIYKNVKLNEDIYIYVIQPDAGLQLRFRMVTIFTTQKNDADFLRKIDDETSFLNTKDEKATMTVVDNEIYLRGQGEIYSFDSPAYYKTGDDFHTIGLHLDASP